MKQSLHHPPPVPQVTSTEPYLIIIYIPKCILIKKNIFINKYSKVAEAGMPVKEEEVYLAEVVIAKFWTYSEINFNYAGES